MAQLNVAYDPRDHDPDSRPDPLPAGIYRFMILGTDVQRTKAGDGSFLKVEHEVQGGPHNGRRFFNQLTLENPNIKAVEIGQRQLSALCHAVGYLQPLQDSDELHGQSGEAELEIEPEKTVNGKNYGPQNRVKRYILPNEAKKPAVVGGTTAQPAAQQAAAGKKKPWLD